MTDFTFNPAEHIATSPANFDQYQILPPVYVVGRATDERFRQLTAALLRLKMTASTELQFGITAKDYVASVTQLKEGVLRAVGQSRMALQPFCEQLMQALATERLLGYNPWKRK